MSRVQRSESSVQLLRPEPRYSGSRLKVAEELLSNFQNFNFKKFALVVKMIVSYYIIYTNYFDRPGIKATICKIYIFSVVISIFPKYYCTQLSCVENIISC